MPSKSKKQAKFMAMCAHSENPPKSCPPKKVAKEFNKADAKTGILKDDHKPIFSEWLNENESNWLLTDNTEIDNWISMVKRNSEIPGNQNFVLDKQFKTVDSYGSIAITDDILIKVNGKNVLPVNFGHCSEFLIDSDILDSFKGSPIHKIPRFIVHQNKNIKEFDGISPMANRYGLCGLTGITSFHNIHKFIKEAYILEAGPSVKSSILGLLLIKKLNSILVRNINVDLIGEVYEIIAKHLKGDKDVLACQEELISAGYKEYAKL